MSKGTNSEGKKRNLQFAPALLALFIALLLFGGCPQESESEYILSDDGYADFDPQSSQTMIGVIVDEWRLFSIIFLMISIGLISLAYPVSTALSLPELKAWAEVELGEAVSTVLVVVFVMAILVFAELTTHALVGGIPELGCDVTGERFCPITVAEQYLQKEVLKFIESLDIRRK